MVSEEHRKNDLLQKIYFTPGLPGSFSSSHVLKKILKQKYNTDVSLKKISEWLSNQKVHSLHKPAPQNYPRNPIVVKNVDEQWQGDLMFLPDLAGFNDNTSTFLLVIDVLSKYIWIEPLSNKSGPECARAFTNILVRASPRKPEKLQTDDGTEFFIAHFKRVTNKYGIKHFSTKSDMKAAVAERAIKTIKEKIYKYITSDPRAGNYYLDQLQNIVKSYNLTYHSTTGKAPASVTTCDSGLIVEKMYGKLWGYDRGKPKCDLKVGDHVRISSRKTPLSKRYKGN